jgi:hypothetical protein
MQTGQNSIAPENSLPQLGQVRWGSVLIDLTVLPGRSELCKGHGFPRQAAAARLGNHVPGSERLAIPSSTEWCETHRRALLASCGRASIANSRRSTGRVSHAIRVWNKPSGNLAAWSYSISRAIDWLAGELCNMKAPRSDMPLIFSRKLVIQRIKRALAMLEIRRQSRKPKIDLLKRPYSSFLEVSDTPQMDAYCSVLAAVS